MKGLSNLVIKNLKLNKRKTIIILFTIILATILITASGLIPLNIYKDYTSKTRAESGKYQILINNLEEENLEKIKIDGNIVESGVSTLYGMKGNQKFSIFYYDEKAFELSPFQILNGRLAMNKGEIVLDENYISANNIDQKIGEKIALEYVNVEGKEEKKTFELVGISSSTAQAKVKGIYYGFVSEAELKSLSEENLLWSMYSNTLFNDRQDIEVYTQAIEEIFKVKGENIRLNDLYISSGKIDWNLVLTGSLVILIVMIATIMVIYSIFYISINEKINEFGKLRALGATKKDIRKMIFKEGIIISVIAIPIGMIIGYGITSFISHKLLFENISFDFFSEVIIVISAGIVTLITVLASLIRPAKIASKISPIEAVKYTDTNLKGKGRKSTKKINLFRLTKFNMLRHKKRSFITISSIMVSFILLILIATVVESFNMNKAANRYVSGDFVLTTSRDFMEYKYGVFDEGLISELSEIEGVQEVNKIGLTSCSFDNKGNLKLINKENLGLETIDSYILGYEENMINDLEKGLLEGKIDIEGLNNKEIIIFRSESDNKFRTAVGDKIALNVKDKNGDFKEIEFKVQAIVNSEYMESLDMIGVGEVFVSSKNTVDSIYGGDSAIKIQINAANNLDTIEEYLNDVTKKNSFFTYQSREVTRGELGKEFLGIKLVAYVLTTMILVISILNYINTMATSVITRKKEFATLQAIGVTNKGIKKMLKLESALYIGVGGTLGGLIGSVLGLLVVKILENQAIFINYKYPVGIVVVAIILGAGVQILITEVLQRKVTKETIVKRLKS
ncbi:MAG: ABC transporter permease [Sarcina sp.]